MAGSHSYPKQHTVWEEWPSAQSKGGGEVHKVMLYGNEDITLDRPLIISYSGNTHRITQGIQTATGGDWCEIHPWQPYPMVFLKLLHQVKWEVESRYYPRLLPVSHSPRSYSMIFVGSPNWCGTIAPPLASQLHQNDLSGKIILPFYSHCGGVSSDLRQDIARLCPKADVREALGVIDDGGDGLKAILQQWFARTGIADTRSVRDG